MNGWLVALLGLGGAAWYLAWRSASPASASPAIGPSPAPNYVPVAPAAPASNYLPVDGLCVDTGQCGPGMVYGPTAWTPAPNLCARRGAFCVGPIRQAALAAQRATACGCAPEAMAL